MEHVNVAAVQDVVDVVDEVFGVVEDGDEVVVVAEGVGGEAFGLGEAFFASPLLFCGFTEEASVD